MSVNGSSNRLPVLAQEIKAAHEGVQDAARTAAERALEAGHALIEAKTVLGTVNGFLGSRSMLGSPTGPLSSTCGSPN